jgi:phosphoribosylformimino-5-aminoimidazole carboxamide ribotide isomerase
VIPAIDLRGGRVVRLEQGDFGRETAFSSDPVEVARGFVSAGARWLHLVDLDGARDGTRRQDAVVGDVVAAARDARVQVAGGLRDPSSIASALGSGAARVVLGTAAITDPELVARAVDQYGAARVAVALDVRDGQAVGAGWRPDAPKRAARDVLDTLSRRGVTTFIVTAIARDGLLGGPDLDLLEDCLAVATDATVIASGGVTTSDDLRAVRRIGCGGAIVGRAIYDGRLDLASTLREIDGISGRA